MAESAEGRRLRPPPGLPDRPFGRILDAFARFDRTWYLCGGWAVDAWLGTETREHGDVDIAVFERDQRALFEHLAGWHLIAHDEVLGGATTAPWDGHDLALPDHIHARRDPTDDLDFEFIINSRAGDDWLLDPPMNTPGLSGPDDVRIPMPVGSAIRELPGGIPAAAPEVLQFFKAVSYRDDDRYPRPHDEVDFVALVPLLDARTTTWLKGAIHRYVPDHPWLAHLG